jgi:hypothetical protein
VDRDPDLTARLRRRLTELEQEFQDGQQMLAGLEARAQALRETMLRLSGAITVLREELDASGAQEVTVGPDHELA